MKNEITKLLDSDNSILKINNFCQLRRWKKDALGNDVDKLVMEFSLTHKYSHTYEIAARDWRGVVEEVQAAQTKAFADAAEELNKQLANGRIG